MSPLSVPPRVTIVEVGPRDGLQNEKTVVSAADKIAFVNLLTAAGPPVIEVGAFVSAKWVPQMAATGSVLSDIHRSPHTRYPVLVPNMQGFERARAAGAEEIAMFAAASETFSRKNINQTIDESFKAYALVCQAALAVGMRVRGYLSTCFGCPYEGPVPPSRVAALAARMREMGVFEVSISDTIGVAHPGQVPLVVGAVVERLPLSDIALHFHDTRGTALANVLMGLQLGVTTYDASCGGLGGCPYAPGAAGNLATEDLVYMLDGLGVETGVSLEKLLEASKFIQQRVGHRLPSRYVQAAIASGDVG